MEQHPAALTVEDSRWRVLGHHGTVFLVAVVPTVIQLVADQRAQTQAIPVGAVELALCTKQSKAGRGREEEKKLFLELILKAISHINRSELQQQRAAFHCN